MLRWLGFCFRFKWLFLIKLKIVWKDTCMRFKILFWLITWWDTSFVFDLKEFLVSASCYLVVTKVSLVLTVLFVIREKVVLMMGLWLINQGLLKISGSLLDCLSLWVKGLIWCIEVKLTFRWAFMCAPLSVYWGEAHFQVSIYVCLSFSVLRWSSLSGEHLCVLPLLVYWGEANFQGSIYVCSLF